MKQTISYTKVKIVETGAQLFSSDYSTFNVETKHFASLDEAKAYLKEKYASAKRGKMYRDNDKGEAEQCGYIFKFRNADYSHAPVVPWNQCDWVSISQVEETEIAA